MSQPGHPSALLPHLSFVAVYVLWGMNMSSLKFGAAAWQDPVLFNGYRYLSIIPLLWAYTYWYYRKHSLTWIMPPRHVLWMSLMGILSAVGMEVVLTYALQYSNTANGAVLGRGFMPIITALLALCMRELRLTWRILAGIPLALASVVLIVGGGEHGFHISAETLRGDLLLLLRSLFGAIYLIGVGKMMNRYPLPLLVSVEMTAGAIVLLPYVLWQTDLSALAALPQSGWISLAYTSVAATALGFTLHNWSLGKLGPFKSSVYGYLLPVTAAISGYILLGEQIGWNQIVGGAGVLLAMYLVQQDRMQLLKQARTTAQIRRDADA
ncbi:DMT family transporter [Paenibacillus sp. y28]|uniref:DMT family transporter n=1 Tax=Paenibacillus sp. y28 TaxID=3129110 RepID=UPI003016ECB8